MTSRLIVNADDYGRTAQVCHGIRAAHLGGIVTSTTAMMNLPGVEEELRLAMQRTPDLGLGVHLVLTSGRPVLPPERIPSLVDADGAFLRPGPFAGRLALIDPAEARLEWRAQIEKFRHASGGEPTHLDSHHHSSYFSEALFRVMLELAGEYGLPVRMPLAANVAADFPDETVAAVHDFFPRLVDEFRPTMPENFISAFYDAGATKPDLLAMIATLPDGTTEIMTHPGHCTDELLQVTTYSRQRQVELEILTDPEVVGLVRRNGIELISFAGL